MASYKGIVEERNIKEILQGNTSIIQSGQTPIDKVDISCVD
jgi:hypothetical protein